MAGIAIPLALGALLALGGGIASAATVSGTSESGVKTADTGKFAYTAEVGEANAVLVDWASDEGWIFEDSGAVIRPGHGCSGGGRRATCRLSYTGPDEVRVSLGDGDDVLSVPGSRERSTVRAGGGPGADVLRLEGTGLSPFGFLDGEEGNDWLTTTRGGFLQGGPGNDRLEGNDVYFEELHGGPGADVLMGLGANDVLAPGRDADPDVVDGGAGNDAVSYVSSDADRAPYTVDIGAARGAPGDELRSIESAVGGYGDDVLRGDAGRNTLDGGYGDDELSGGGGDDVLRDPHGNDTLHAGPGDDRVDPWGYEDEEVRDRVSCGPGNDALTVRFRLHSSASPVVPDDCERVQLDELTLGSLQARPRAARGTLSWSLLVPRSAAKPVYVFIVRLRAGGRDIGRGSARVARGRRGPVRVRLSPRGRALLARGARLQVSITERYRVSGDLVSGDTQGYAVDPRG